MSLLAPLSAGVFSTSFVKQTSAATSTHELEDNKIREAPGRGLVGAALRCYGHRKEAGLPWFRRTLTSCAAFKDAGAPARRSSVES